MFTNVTAHVSAETHGKQQPERLSRLRTEVMLLPGKPEAKLQPPPSKAAQRWADIKRRREIAVFEASRKQYGPANPLYDTLAAQRIENMKIGQAQRDQEAIQRHDEAYASQPPVNSYAELAPDKQLQRAVNDAKLMRKTFDKLGFEVIPVAENLTRRDFIEHWHSFLKRIQPGAMIAFFFAGHGVSGGQPLASR
ncbi:MAG: caspase family protein [Rhodomicrobium sp.]